MILADNLPQPVREQDTAADFHQFLKALFDDAFPDKSELPIHLATASHGGYFQHIMESRRHNPDNAFWGDIQSLILIDAVIDFTAMAVGGYEKVCKDRESVGLLNDSACDSMKRHMPEQLRLDRVCQDVYHGEECRESYDYGQKYIHAAMNELVEQQKITLGNIKKGCKPIDYLPYCLPVGLIDAAKYFNQKKIKDSLGVSDSFNYRSVNADMHLAFREYGSPWNPTTKELIRVLDAYGKEPELADIKVLVMNGNNDYVVTAASQMWQYDRLEWTGQKQYASNEWQPLGENLPVTGLERA